MRKRGRSSTGEASPAHCISMSGRAIPGGCLTVTQLSCEGPYGKSLAAKAGARVGQLSLLARHPARAAHQARALKGACRLVRNIAAALQRAEGSIQARTCTAPLRKERGGIISAEAEVLSRLRLLFPMRRSSALFREKQRLRARRP